MTRNEREFNHDPSIRAMAEEMNLALVFLYGHKDRDFYFGGSMSVFNPENGHDTTLLNILKDLSLLAGKPEIEHAPWLTFGHSTSGLFARHIAWWKPERMFGVILYKSGGYVPPDFVENPDTATFLNIPWLSVAARNDKFGPGQQGWNNMIRDMMPWRKLGALMSQIVEPTMEEGHSVWRPFNGPYFAMWIKKAVERKIPADEIAANEPVDLRHIENSSGMLSDSAIARLIDVEELSDMLLRYPYDVENKDREKMFWHFDDEMAITWVNYHHKEYGEFDPMRDTTLTGLVKYWRETIVFASPENTARVHGQSQNHDYPSGMTVETDNDGNYEVISYDRLVRITRDIPGDFRDPDAAGSVLDAINGYDAYLLKKIISESEDYIPALPDILAADVNMDGIINPEDLEQLTSRAVLSISEFKQDWNYQGTETPLLDEPSLDYVFFDKSKTSFNLEAKISKDYPADDGIGYSRYRFPSISDTVIAPYEVGNPYPEFLDATFLGLMLGDLDGSDGKSEDISENYKVKIALGNATQASETLKIPVYIENISGDPVHSIDGEVSFSENSLNLQSLSSDQTENVFSHHKADTLYFISYKMEAFNTEEPAIYINSGNTELKAEDFQNVRTFINGKSCLNEVFTNPLQTDIQDAENYLSIFPNPVNDRLTISFPRKVSGEIWLNISDLSGKRVKTLESKTINNSGISLLIADLKPGIYLINIQSENNSWNSRFIKK